jgi:hypothetical protein
VDYSELMAALQEKHSAFADELFSGTAPPQIGIYYTWNDAELVRRNDGVITFSQFVFAVGQFCLLGEERVRGRGGAVCGAPVYSDLQR